MEPRQLPDHLLSQGRHTFTSAEAEELLGLEDAALRNALRRLARKGHLFSPARGLYVLVPPEYRSWGVVPAEWFVDELMRHLGRPYYVGLLSAAAAHGASHQAPQVFQVVTPVAAEPRDIRRVRLRFHESVFFPTAETMPMTVPTGQMTVSTRETTVVDLVGSPRLAGGLDNVATIVGEIGELHGSALARIAAPRGLSVVRRTGWLVEKFGEADDLEALRQASRIDQGYPSLLESAQGKRGSVDKQWKLRINREVEPDL